MALKRCARCNELKSTADFCVRKREKDGLNYWCRQCTSEIGKKFRSDPINLERARATAKAWRQANPEKARATHDAWIANNRERAATAHKFRQLRHRYGITRSQYENLMRESGGKCQLCRSDKRLCVDHCHESSVVRGILCVLCNTAVERFENVEDFAAKAAEYLEKHNEVAS